jgi:predicted nuclease with TOPRIM domain
MNTHAHDRTWSAAYAESDGDHERHVADYGGQKPMTDDDHEEILQALMNTTIRAQKAEATIARHEDTIAGLRAFPAVAERGAALRQNADLQAENNRLLDRARNDAALAAHYGEKATRLEAELDAAVDRADRAEAEVFATRKRWSDFADNLRQTELAAATARADALAGDVESLRAVVETAVRLNSFREFNDHIPAMRAALSDGAKTNAK